jgi:uncharacterized coiled-coil DUF342 family protein
MLSDAERAQLIQQLNQLNAEKDQIQIQIGYDFQNVTYLSEQIGYINMNLMRFDLTNDQRAWYENQKRILTDQLNYYNTKISQGRARQNAIFFEIMAINLKLCG